MPLTRKQFELGIDSEIEAWMKRIYQFLKERKEEAFTEEEIADELNGWFPQDKKLKEKVPGLVVHPLPTVQTALQKLAEIGSIEVREVRDMHYYALGYMPLEL